MKATRILISEKGFIPEEDPPKMEREQKKEDIERYDKAQRRREKIYPACRKVGTDLTFNNSENHKHSYSAARFSRRSICPGASNY